ncbi:unnamed protein product [Larinioides sclopetarius]|uniref:Thyroglobulin type-1 domain-containing protein n=1 Tax=Larinioides sclopetarius TaxID=280406 RepID=A0AAV2AXS7_9ARAC
MFALKSLFLCISVLVFCCVDAQRIFGCKGVCETKGKDCKVSSCKNDTIYKNATECGCCDVCIISLNKDEKCETEVLPSIPRQACGPGLMCDKQEKKCVPVKTQCIADRAKHRYTLSLKDLPYRTSWPECDEFGYYKSMVCLPDILCYCVDKNGKRIFGTEIDSKVDKKHLEMYCKCSREYEEFPRSVQNGDFLRCLPNGDYDRLQCTEEWCYCMESEHPDIIEDATFNTTLKELSCYDETVHKYFDAAFRSKCWNERNNLKQIIKKHKDQNIALIGIDLPECDLDGSYAPVQCKNEK